LDGNSLEGDARSHDPDHEPRKEGGPSKNMKQSPSVIEISQVDGHQSDVPSIGERGDKGRSPNAGTRINQ